MHNRPVIAGRSSRRADLEHTPGICRGDDIRGRRRDVSGFALAEFRGHLRLYQVEDTGAAAADVAFRHRDECHARNRREQIARLLTNSLCVPEVAGVVIGDAHLDAMSWRLRRAERCKYFGDVPYLRGE